MQVVIDILENELIEKYPDVLGILLRDQTTQENIFWATDNYKHLGDSYRFNSEILPELITGEKGNVIMPRVHKDKILQLSRSKEMAEVFTPSWICNAQNNLVDNSWFGKDGVFNKEILLKNGTKSWETAKEKIVFSKGKTWQDYVRDTRLEISCGVAPYLVSRYDTVSGKEIAIEERIGLLDRKLRIVNENTENETDWMKWVIRSYESIYGYEYQGDNILIARENLLYTFIEYMENKFSHKPTNAQLKKIARIISWNIWQMDGITMTVPFSEQPRVNVQMTLFDFMDESEKEDTEPIPCRIFDWRSNESIEFRNMLKGGKQ